jgi:hypothetical protein
MEAETVLINFISLFRCILEKYSYFSNKHNTVFIVDITLLHVSALFTGHRKRYNTFFMYCIAYAWKKKNACIVF